MELNERVRYLRQDILHMSQREFAEALDSSRDEINNIEINRLKRPEQKAPLLRLMCKTFNVSDEWLIQGIGDPDILRKNEEEAYVSELLHESDNPLCDIIKAIMKTYNDASEKDQKVIKEFASEFRKNLKNEGQD